MFRNLAALQEAAIEDSTEAHGGVNCVSVSGIVLPVSIFVFDHLCEDMDGELVATDSDEVSQATEAINGHAADAEEVAEGGVGFEAWNAGGVKAFKDSLGEFFVHAVEGHKDAGRGGVDIDEAFSGDGGEVQVIEPCEATAVLVIEPAGVEAEAEAAAGRDVTGTDEAGVNSVVFIILATTRDEVILLSVVIKDADIEAWVEVFFEELGGADGVIEAAEEEAVGGFGDAFIFPLPLAGVACAAGVEEWGGVAGAEGVAVTGAGVEGLAAGDGAADDAQAVLAVVLDGENFTAALAAEHEDELI